MNFTKPLMSIPLIFIGVFSFTESPAIGQLPPVDWSKSTINRSNSGQPTTTLKLSGNGTAGDILTIMIKNPKLPTGKKSIDYKVLSSDTLSTIATGFASSINNDKVLKESGITSTSSSATITIKSDSPNTLVTTWRNMGATETMDVIDSKASAATKKSTDEGDR